VSIGIEYKLELQEEVSVFAVGSGNDYCVVKHTLDILLCLHTLHMIFFVSD